jgi:hypothetical protein
MKKIILTSFILCSVLAFSQEIKFGAKAGLNLSNLRGNYPVFNEQTTGADEADLKNKSVIGFHIGGFAEFVLNEKFSVQPELLLSKQGSKVEFTATFYEFSDGTGERDIETLTQRPKITYINLPIMFKYKVLEKLSIEFGPQIGYVISGKSAWTFEGTDDETEKIEIDLLKDGTYEFLGTTIVIKKGLNRLDYGLNIGASYDITEKLFIQGRYNLGLSTVDKNSTNGTDTKSWDLKNSVIQISTGYRF